MPTPRGTCHQVSVAIWLSLFLRLGVDQCLGGCLAIDTMEAFDDVCQDLADSVMPNDTPQSHMTYTTPHTCTTTESRRNGLRRSSNHAPLHSDYVTSLAIRTSDRSTLRSWLAKHIFMSIDSRRELKQGWRNRCFMSFFGTHHFGDGSINAHLRGCT